jgi:hypothetical protein
MNFCYAADSDLGVHLTSWKANNISGYICSTADSSDITIIFDKLYNGNVRVENSLIRNLPIHSESKICNNNQYDFYFNIYSNITLLNNILDGFPVSITTDPRDPVNSIFALDFSCSNSNQTIMQLKKPKNSHVYAWNVTLSDNYPICYNDLFGYDFEGNFYPSDCTNPVIWKSQLNNAHASTSFLSGDYPEKVCYGDLICSYKQGNCLTSEGSQILKLYYYNNTHVSYFNDSNYPISICCISNFKPNPIKNARWDNMEGEEISYANLSDYVRLSLEGETIEPSSLINRLINYTIYDSSNAPIFFAQEVADSNNPSILWKAEYGNYTFNAVVANNYLLNKTSKKLIVSNDYGDDNFNISIEKPKCAEDFKINSSIEFKIKITTPNQLVNGTITLGDGNYKNITNNKDNTITFFYSYLTDGTKNVVLQVTNSKYTVSKRKIVNIILLNESKSGVYLAACIDSPEDTSNINTQKVTCNASSSKAINYRGITNSYTLINIDKINFSWSFSDNSIHQFSGILNNNSNSECYQQYDIFHYYINPSGEVYNNTLPCTSTTKGYFFTKYFAISGKNKADLTISL